MREAVGEAVNLMQSIMITEELTSNLGGEGGEGRSMCGRRITSVLILSPEGFHLLPLLWFTTTTTFQSTSHSFLPRLPFNESPWWCSGSI